jgi:heme exporter protein D
MSAFFNMGGYAFYVWSSIGLFFLAMIIDLVSLKLKDKAVKRNIRAFLRRKKN